MEYVCFYKIQTLQNEWRNECPSLSHIVYKPIWYKQHYRTAVSSQDASMQRLYYFSESFTNKHTSQWPSTFTAPQPVDCEITAVLSPGWHQSSTLMWQPTYSSVIMHQLVHWKNANVGTLFNTLLSESSVIHDALIAWHSGRTLGLWPANFPVVSCCNCMCANVYGWRHLVKATEVTTGLAGSNSSLPPGGWCKVTCELTGCTPASAPGSTLGNEYGT